VASVRNGRVHQRLAVGHCLRLRSRAHSSGVPGGDDDHQVIAQRVVPKRRVECLDVGDLAPSRKLVEERQLGGEGAILLDEGREQGRPQRRIELLVTGRQLRKLKEACRAAAGPVRCFSGAVSRHRRPGREPQRDGA